MDEGEEPKEDTREGPAQPASGGAHGGDGHGASRPNGGGNLECRISRGKRGGAGMTSHSGNRYADLGRDFIDFSRGNAPAIPDTTKLRLWRNFLRHGGFLPCRRSGPFRMKPVFAHEPDQDARASYAANFGLMALGGDTLRLDAGEHGIDILLGRVPKDPRRIRPGDSPGREGAEAKRHNAWDYLPASHGAHPRRAWMCQ